MTFFSQKTFITLFGKAVRFLKRIWRGGGDLINEIIAEKHYYTSLVSYAFEFPEEVKIININNVPCFYLKKLDSNVNKWSKNSTVVYSDYVLFEGGINTTKFFLIKNVTCFAFSDILLLDNGNCLYDIKEYDTTNKKINFIDEIILKDTQSWCKLKSFKNTRFIPKAIKIGGMFGFNYYHFMLQILPKLLEFSDIDASIPILLDCAAYDIENMRQFISYINNRDIIYMTYGTAYFVGELYSVTSPNFCVPNLKHTDYNMTTMSLYTKSSINNIRTKFLPMVDKAISYERIFICRKGITKRRFYNEDELLQIALKFGFKPVHTEILNPIEQISLFYNAKIIVAATGAALSNLLFVRPKCKVVVLYNKIGFESIFGTLALINNADFIALCDSNKGHYQKDFYIEPEVLNNVLKEIIDNETTI